MRTWFQVAVGTCAAVWLYAAATLPAEIPVHFGPGGEVDRFASRTEALVTFAVLGVVLAGTLGWVVRMYRGRYPPRNHPDLREAT